MRNGEAYSVVLIKCVCGRVKKNSEWYRPRLDELQEIEENIDSIIFKDEVCQVCASRTKRSLTD